MKYEKMENYNGVLKHKRHFKSRFKLVNTLVINVNR